MIGLFLVVTLDRFYCRAYPNDMPPDNQSGVHSCQSASALVLRAKGLKN